MTRKDFQMIADVVATTLATVTPESRQCLALDFAAELAKTNTRFDAGRFVKACLVNERAENQNPAWQEVFMTSFDVSGVPVVQAKA